jgi:hypothetical protein
MRLISVVVAVGCVVGLVGCSASKPSAAPTFDPAPVAPTPTGLVLTPEQQAVADAVTRYFKVVDDISTDEKVSIGEIKTVAAGQWATDLANDLFAARGLGLKVVGKGKSEVLSVKVASTDATLEECFDGREVYTLQEGQKSVSDEQRAEEKKPPYIGIVSLKKTSNKWFVTGLKAGKECPAK